MTTRVEMLKGFPRNLTVCEAGTRKCVYAKYMISKKWLDPEHLYLMDINTNSEVEHFTNNHDNATFLLGTFSDRVKDLPEIDMVYIDGLHSYSNVSRDLRDFDPITTRWLAGHDWVNEGVTFKNHLQNDAFEVREAVTDWLKNKDYYLTYVTDDISNPEHDPDANWPHASARPLRSWVVSKTKEDHDLFLHNLEQYSND
tara:strand:- start:5137 stop:5733 length:597 start_codon:yes stop_codon:yes gene_type:complete